MKSSLSDADYDRLAEILDGFPSDHAMNLEMMDGFFAALISCPDLVPPGEFLSEIWGGESQSGFASVEEMQEFLNLAMAHWNAVAGQLRSGDVFWPLFLEEDDGTVLGNDWAIGFVRGMDIRKQDWTELLDDEDHACALIPVFALVHEHDPDPELRPYKKPISPELRENLIAGCAAGAMMIYRYFEPHRRERAAALPGPPSYRRENSKAGRNELCPCGSGKKYKRCCGGVTVQ